MRVGAEWIYSKEFGNSDEDPGWIGVGYITADAGALLLLIALILCRDRASRKGNNGLARAAGVSSLIAVVGLARRRLGDERQALTRTGALTD